MNENDFLNRLAEALNTLDTEELAYLVAWNDGLLQDEESHRARTAVLDAALNAAFELSENN